MNLVESILVTVACVTLYAIAASFVGKWVRRRATRFNASSSSIATESADSVEEHRHCRTHAAARRKASIRDGLVFAAIVAIVSTLKTPTRASWLDPSHFIGLICIMIVPFALGMLVSRLVRWLFFPQGDFRYSLKSLFLLTAVASIPAAFHAAQHRRQASEEVALRELEAILGQPVVSDYLHQSFGIRFVTAVEIPEIPISKLQVHRMAEPLSRLTYLSFVSVRKDSLTEADLKRMRAVVPHARVDDYQRRVSSRQTPRAVPPASPESP